MESKLFIGISEVKKQGRIHFEQFSVKFAGCPAFCLPAEGKGGALCSEAMRIITQVRVTVFVDSRLALGPEG